MSLSLFSVSFALSLPGNRLANCDSKSCLLNNAATSLESFPLSPPALAPIAHCCDSMEEDSAPRPLADMADPKAFNMAAELQFINGFPLPVNPCNREAEEDAVDDEFSRFSSSSLLKLGRFRRLLLPWPLPPTLLLCDCEREGEEDDVEEEHPFVTGVGGFEWGLEELMVPAAFAALMALEAELFRPICKPEVDPFAAHRLINWLAMLVELLQLELEGKSPTAAAALAAAVATFRLLAVWKEVNKVLCPSLLWLLLFVSSWNEFNRWFSSSFCSSSSSSFSSLICPFRFSTAFGRLLVWFEWQISKEDPDTGNKADVALDFCWFPAATADKSALHWASSCSAKPFVNVLCECWLRWPSNADNFDWLIVNLGVLISMILEESTWFGFDSSSPSVNDSLVGKLLRLDDIALSGRQWMENGLLCYFFVYRNDRCNWTTLDFIWTWLIQTWLFVLLIFLNCLMISLIVRVNGRFCDYKARLLVQKWLFLLLNWFKAHVVVYSGMLTGVLILDGLFADMKW